MKHLETKREAAERRRVVLMSKGIATFLERTSRETDQTDEPTEASNLEINGPKAASQAGAKNSSSDIEMGDGPEVVLDSSKPSPPVKESILDKIRMTLDQAADILRESLELSVGSVVFLDTGVGYTETDSTDAYTDTATDLGAEVQQKDRDWKQRQRSNEDSLRPTMIGEDDLGRHLSKGSTRNSTDKHKAAKVLAMSAAKKASWDPRSRVLDGKTLQSLLKSYPKGNVWYIDDEGYFSSLEQINELDQTVGRSPSGRKHSISPQHITKQKAEATLLSRIFQNAKQIIFLPLWDAGAGK